MVVHIDVGSGAGVESGIEVEGVEKVGEVWGD
jgi:hypothetical protein